MEKRARSSTTQSEAGISFHRRRAAALGGAVVLSIALLVGIAMQRSRPAEGTRAGAATAPSGVPADANAGADAGADRSAPLPEARLRDAAARSPGVAAARQELGRYLLDQGRPFEAIWELSSAHHLNPGDPSITVQLAVALASGSLYDAAIARLEELVGREPPSREGRVQLATLYLAKRQAPKAVALLRGAPGLASWAEGQHALGKAHEAAGETDAAAVAYRRALALVPAAEEPRLRLGRLYLRQGRVPEARHVLQSAPSDAPSSPRVLTLLAESTLDSGSRLQAPGSRPEPEAADAASAARKWLRAALEADPSHVPALVALGGLEVRQNRLKDAMRAYGEALRLAPGDAVANLGAAAALQAAGRAAEAHALRARAFRAQGLPARAIREYEALSRFPGHYRDAILEMSLLLVQTQQKPRAARVVERALERYPLDTALYERLVVLQLIVRQHAAARRRCEEWQKLDPRSRRPAWLLAQVAADSGDLSEARRLLEPVVAAEPGNTEYAATLAEILLKEDRPPLPRVRDLLERAVTSPAVEPKTHLQLAEVLQQLGDYDAARWQALRALERDPNLSEPYALLAQLARQLGQPEQVRFWSSIVRSAEERIRTGLLLSRHTWAHPDDPVGHRDLALHLLQAVELRRAESHLEEALRLRPGWLEVQQLLEQVRRTREVL